MKKLLAVAVGGAIGSLVRYLSIAKGDEIGLFLINILGVAVAGFVAFRMTTSELWQLVLIPGFAGGLTTFSSVAVIHAEKSSLLAVIYFQTMVVVSIAILYVIKPKAMK